jgi:hypothetical protein
MEVPMSEPAGERPVTALCWADHASVLLAGAAGGYLALALITKNLCPANANLGGAGGLFCGASVGLLAGYVPGVAVLVETRGRRGVRLLALLAAVVAGAFFAGVITVALAFGASC